MPDIERKDELRTLATQPVGTVVFVAETQERLIAVGNFPPRIAAALHWSQPNIWLPERAGAYIRGRHPIFPDLVAAIQTTLANPMGIYHGTQRANTIHVLVDADLLRERGLLPSRSAPYVDAIIERRSVLGGFYHRLYHCSPATRNKGGLRLWP